MVPENNVLKERIFSLPENPGVYSFLDVRGKVLYVGKAKNLSNRVKSYFWPGRDNRPQIPKLMSLVHDFRFLVTSSEKEALILENNLIKETKPEFNICLKDDKTYKSIKFCLEEEFPKIVTVRNYTPDKKNLYFGPYCDAGDVKVALRQILAIFRIRDCSESEFKRRKKTNRPCMKYHIKHCSAPCSDFISKEEYLKSVQQAVECLNGHNDIALQYMKERMNFFSKSLEYEKAQEYLEKYEAIKTIRDTKSEVTGFVENADVIGWHMEGSEVYFQILIIRFGKIISSDHEFFKDKNGTMEELLRQFLDLYYQDPVRIPSEIWLPLLPEDCSLLEEILSQRKGASCQILVPKKGKKSDVVRMAQKNAQMNCLNQKKNQSQIEALAFDFKEKLNLSQPVYTMECYDISHSSGKDIVGVKVVFKNFRPFKKAYRRYHIRITVISDDYLSLYEVLTRRVKRGKEQDDLPDLIIVDGGLGQVSVLERVLKENNLSVSGAGIAKENHSKSSLDSVYTIGRKNPLPLKHNDPVLLKIMQIRDEAHRFAVKFHLAKRQKRIFNS